MADKKITELTELTTPALEDLLPIVDDPSGTPETKKITLNTLKDNIFIDTRIATKIVAADGSGDYSDIQSAINALPAGGGLVFIKNGTYTINSSITITKSNVALVGQGPATIIKLNNNKNTNVIVLGDGTNPYSNIILKDFKIDGNKANQTSGSGIYIKSYVTRSKIDGVWVYQTKQYGAYLDTDADYTSFTDCIFEETEYSDIYFYNSDHCSASGCKFINFGLNGGYGITAYYSGSGKILGNLFVHSGDANSRPAIALCDGSYFSIVGNVFKGCYTALTVVVMMFAPSSCFFSGNSIFNSYSDAIARVPASSIISNNIIYTAGGRGIYVDRGNVKVCNNDIRGVSQTGIETNGLYTIITGNFIDTCGYDNIKLNGASYGVVSSNILLAYSKAADNTYSGIYLYGKAYAQCLRNLIIDNIILGSTFGNRNEYGIAESASYANYNFIRGNLCLNAKTQEILINGANSDASENTIT